MILCGNLNPFYMLLENLFLSEYFRQDKGENTDASMLVVLLLKAAQKVPKLAEGRTRHLVPLFLTFVGQNDGDLER
jgi:hypothetical protein